MLQSYDPFYLITLSIVDEYFMIAIGDVLLPSTTTRLVEHYAHFESDYLKCKLLFQPSADVDLDDESTLPFFCHQINSLKFSFETDCRMMLRTVLFPKFRTRQFRYVIEPTSAVTFFIDVVSKYGPRSRGFGTTSSPLFSTSKPLSPSKSDCRERCCLL